jgi:integral membrane protein
VPVEPSSPQSADARSAAAAPPAMPPRVKSALARYRVAAFIVGYALIVLCIAIVLRYVFGVEQAVAIWGPIHGVLYIGYVLLAFDLAYKDRWSLVGTLGVLVAGVIPGVSFVAERIVHRKVQARQKV